MRTEVVVEPTEQPLSIQEVKAHLKITHNDDESYIQRLIEASTRYCEETLNISLITQQRATFYDQISSSHKDVWWSGARLGSISELFEDPEFLELRGGPVNSIVKFETFDEDAVATEWDASNYYLSASAVSNIPPARVVRKTGSTWPIADRRIDGIKITHLDGFGADWNTIPMDVRHGLQMLIGHWYANRETVLTKISSKRIEFGVKDAWSRYYEKRI